MKVSLVLVCFFTVCAAYDVTKNQCKSPSKSILPGPPPTDVVAPTGWRKLSIAIFAEASDFLDSVNAVLENFFDRASAILQEDMDKAAAAASAAASGYRQQYKPTQRFAGTLSGTMSDTGPDKKQPR